MESEQASINLQESNNALENTSENRDGGDDLRVDSISKKSGKRKHTSEVWNHFERVMVENIQHAECNYCKTHLKAPASHGTNHLKNHYEKTCKKRPRKMDIRQSLMMTSKKTCGSQDLSTHIFSQEDSRYKLAVMVILHDYALGIVDHEGFQIHEKFEEAVRQLQIDCTKKLSIDCKTRWNSTFLMLETAIIYRDVFPRLKCREKQYKNIPTDDDWEHAIEICDKLQIFYEMTEMFSSTLYPTSNFYFPNICDIKLQLDEWVNSPKMMIRCMAEKMLAKYEKYWDSCHSMMGVAAVLDPRYKMRLVEFYFSQIYCERSQFKVDEIRQNCYDLLLDYQSRSELKENSLSARSSVAVGRISSSCVSGYVVSATLQKYEEFVALSSDSLTLITKTSELDTYLGENVLPRTEDFDILSWWKTNGVKYPNLQKMARDILAIPVSTVASESAFSDSGRLVSPHRSRLHPATLEVLMCARRWLWNNMKGTSAANNLLDCPTILDEEEEDNE